jgi:hypothetical protein
VTGTITAATGTFTSLLVEGIADLNTLNITGTITASTGTFTDLNVTDVATIATGNITNLYVSGNVGVTGTITAVGEITSSYVENDWMQFFTPYNGWTNSTNTSYIWWDNANLETRNNLTKLSGALTWAYNCSTLYCNSTGTTYDAAISWAVCAPTRFSTGRIWTITQVDVLFDSSTVDGFENSNVAMSLSYQTIAYANGNASSVGAAGISTATTTNSTSPGASSNGATYLAFQGLSIPVCSYTASLSNNTTAGHSATAVLRLNFSVGNTGGTSVPVIQILGINVHFSANLL